MCIRDSLNPDDWRDSYKDFREINEIDGNPNYEHGLYEYMVETNGEYLSDERENPNVQLAQDVYKRQTVTYAQTVNDPVKGFLKLKVSYGSAKIVKTSEDGKVDGISFRIPCSMRAISICRASTSLSV